jgi:catechol 2,3-dioxygenase-like lactoylglutathione lyase family enzyme
MKSLITHLAVAALALGAATITASSAPADEEQGSNSMQLGNFSVSLAVKDLQASRAFYEKLGFSKFGGEEAQNWLVLRNGTDQGTVTIGLFQGMFENNIMTFNPGWDHSANTLEEFQDVRDIQAVLKERGITLTTETDPDADGPASRVFEDPDGNTIYIDQHVPRSGS